MENSPLARLSPEIRNEIYSLALMYEEPITLGVSGINNSPYNSVSPLAKHLGSLRHTCRAIREECTRFFYASNTFIFSTDIAVPSALLNFHNSLVELNITTLNPVILDAGRYGITPSDNTIYLTTIQAWLEEMAVLEFPFVHHMRFTFDVSTMFVIRPSGRNRIPGVVSYEFEVPVKSEPSETLRDMAFAVGEKSRQLGPSHWAEQILSDCEIALRKTSALVWLEEQGIDSMRSRRNWNRRQHDRG